MEQAVATVPTESALSLTDIRGQVKLIQDVMEAVMKKDEHYGVIPGTNKPTLLKPGAEKLCLTFRLDPQYNSLETYDGSHLTVKSKCTLYHINSEKRLGSGEGSCSTKETKYAYRHGARKCPHCGKESIIKGKEEFGGGWLCFKKKGGCGAKFADGDTAIESQASGLVPNENLADQYNTVLKIANKRSLVAAVLNVTAASDIFTQDVEDYTDITPEPRKPVVTEAAQAEVAAIDAKVKEVMRPKEGPTPVHHFSETDTQAADLATLKADYDQRLADAPNFKEAMAVKDELSRTDLPKSYKDAFDIQLRAKFSDKGKK